MMCWLRGKAGLLLLDMCNLAITLRMGYVAWLLFRWSLIVMPVDTETRQRAVHWWDTQGALWRYCRWPEPLESTGEP